MFFSDHNPPHFHAEYGEFEALIDIKTLGVMEGKLPPKALGLVVERAQLHQDELRDQRQMGVMEGYFGKIEPLE